MGTKISEPGFQLRQRNRHPNFGISFPSPVLPELLRQTYELRIMILCQLSILLGKPFFLGDRLCVKTKPGNKKKQIVEVYPNANKT